MLSPLEMDAAMCHDNQESLVMLQDLITKELQVFYFEIDWRKVDELIWAQVDVLLGISLSQKLLDEARALKEGKTFLADETAQLPEDIRALAYPI